MGESRWGLQRAWHIWGMIIVGAIAIGSGVVGGLLRDFTLGVLAVTAGAMACVSAALRLLAHDRKDGQGLDGLGKVFGFGASFLAFATGLVVLVAQVNGFESPL